MPVIEDVLCNGSNEGFIEASSEDTEIILTLGKIKMVILYQTIIIDNLTAGDYTNSFFTDFNNVCNKVLS